MLGCTIGELGDRMTSEEFALWLAYRRTQPFGPLLAPLMPMLADMLAAMANGPLQRNDKRLWRADDFLPPRLWAPEPAPAPPSQGPSLADIEQLFGRRG